MIKYNSGINTQEVKRGWGKKNSSVLHGKPPVAYAGSTEEEPES